MQHMLDSLRLNLLWDVNGGEEEALFVARNVLALTNCCSRVCYNHCQRG